MIGVSKQAAVFGKLLRIGILFVTVIFPAIVFGQTDRTKIHGFWVSGSAAVTMKPDQAIVFMVVQGSAACAAGALVQNQRIVQQVDQAMDAMGLEGKYRFSANHFS